MPTLRTETINPSTRRLCLKSAFAVALALASIATLLATQIPNARADSHLTYFQIWSIDADNESPTVYPGERVQLRLNTFDAQGNDLNADVDRALADDIHFRWIGVGDFHEDRQIMKVRKNGRADDRIVSYRVPYTLGIYTIVAGLRSPDICETDRSGGCTGRATAVFTVKVVHRPTIKVTETEPVDPEGLIPTQITDDDGNLYSTALPTLGGGDFDGAASVSLPTSAVWNGTYVGVRISRQDSTANFGAPDNRYTLAGDWYQVDLVNDEGQPIIDYQLQTPATVCLPLPTQFTAHLTEVTVVEGLGSKRALTSRVRFDSDSGLRTCGTTSSLPGSFAAAIRGDVPELREMPPTPTPAPVIKLSVGGSAPTAGTANWLAILGAVVLAGGAWVAVAATRRRHSRST